MTPTRTSGADHLAGLAKFLRRSVRGGIIECMFGETVEVFSPEEWPDADPWPDDADVHPSLLDMLAQDPSMPVPAPPTAAAVVPSGGFALELDWATALPELLSAGALVDAAVGYERLAAWAVARQQEMLAEFHRRPADGTVRPAATARRPGAESGGESGVGRGAGVGG